MKNVEIEVLILEATLIMISFVFGYIIGVIRYMRQMKLRKRFQEQERRKRENGQTGKIKQDKIRI